VVPRLWLLALTLWLAVTSISAIALWHLHREALDSQLREIGLLSLALADEMDRGLRGVEEGLAALRGELRDGRLPTTGADAVPALNSRAKLMPMVKRLWLIDHGGRLLAASDQTSAPDRQSFSPPLDELATDAIAVSRPFTDVNENESLVALAIRFEGMPGTSGGWALAGVPATAFLGAFSVASAGTGARMAVFRDDGARLIGSIVDSPTADEKTVAEHLANRPNMELRRFRDGSERLVSVHDLARFGLKMILTRDMRAALKPWRQTAQVAATGIALLLAILAMAVRQVERADQRRAQAQRALQTQLARASKLESLGTLAGGVAHDFNNVLAAILGFGEMAQDAALPQSNQARHLDKVVQAALRGKALVARILAFSRGGGHAMNLFDLEPIVEEVLTLLVASLRAGVILERRLDAAGARLRGDPTRAFEAIMNLCTNAMQAMADGGMLSVQLERFHVARPLVLSHSQLTTGDYLSLSVSDQGSGIRPDVMDHLFEPFFTTRGAQSGTGLGLALVHGVVAEFGGAIDVQSTPGRGSRFTLYFPECFETTGSTAPLPNGVPMGIGQRLMVVDDEPALVALADEVLKGLGYEPVGYHDPVAALTALRADPARYAAVITDELMPGLTGTQLTAALRPIAPDLPVLLISGYGGALLASRAAAAGVTRVLSKPLQRAELACVLAELLH